VNQEAGRRHELTGAQWDLIKDFSPRQGRGGQWADHRTTFNGILWRLRTGAPWRDLPERYGPWQTIYHRFNALRRTGLLDRILERLQARLNTDGLIDAELWRVDGTVIRASRAAAGAVRAPKKREPGSRPTTPWAAAGAASAPRSTWSATAGACRWRRSPRRGRPTRASSSRAWSGACGSGAAGAGRGAGR